MKRQVAALVHLLPKLHRNPMEERNERAQQIAQALACMNPMTRQDDEIILAQNTYDFYGGKYYITVQSLPWMHACTNERAPLPLNERYTILDKLPYKSNGNRDCLPFTKTLCNTGKRARVFDAVVAMSRTCIFDAHRNRMYFYSKMNVCDTATTKPLVMYMYVCSLNVNG